MLIIDGQQYVLRSKERNQKVNFNSWTWFVRVIQKEDDLLKIGMDDVRFTVQIIQTFEYLLGDWLYILQRYALVVGVDDQLQQIGAQHLEYHTDVRTVRTGDEKIVDQLYDFIAVLVLRIGGSHLVFWKRKRGLACVLFWCFIGSAYIFEQLYFIDCSLRVVGRTLNDL